MPTRRKLLLGLLSGLGSPLALGGCTSLNSLLSPSLSLQADLIKGSHRRASDYPLSAEDLAAIPYSKLGVRIGSEPRLVMLLSSIDGDRLTWISHDRVRFVTCQGRLVQTFGMPRDLADLKWPEHDPLAQLVSAGKSTEQGSCQLAYRRDDESGLEAEVELEVVGRETIQVLGKSRDTVVVSERFDVPDWRWKTENRYWIDPNSAIVWRSRQRYCPEIARLEFEWLAS